MDRAASKRCSRFQSTLPVGGATVELTAYDQLRYLFQSTLPVGGATLGKFIMPHLLVNFNPRSPWGERLGIRYAISQVVSEFQSTLPVGGATRYGANFDCGKIDFNPRSPWGERLSIHAPRGGSDLISIHAPRGGSDAVTKGTEDWGDLFQSTLPVGGATHRIHRGHGKIKFQSTLPVGGATEPFPRQTWP